MQRQVAHKLGLNGENNAGGDGEAGGGESAADIMKKLWTVENLLTVETEWFRCASEFSYFSYCSYARALDYSCFFSSEMLGIFL